MVSKDVSTEVMEWETVQTEAGDQIEFDTIGDVFIGVFVGYDDIKFEDPKEGEKEFRQMHFRDVDDPEKLYDINCGYRLTQACDKLSAGQTARITYVKDLDMGKGNSPMKEYRVDIRK